MANGFCPYLLEHIGQVAKTANPMYKIRPTGFLGMLKTENTPGAIKVDNGQGHKTQVNIKYKKRWRIADTDTTASCDNVLVPAWVEDTASLTNFRQIAIHIEDSVIAQYCEDASKMVTQGAPATQMMNEFYESTILQGANALLGAVNRDLINIMKTKFGVNYRTGLSTAATININKSASTNKLDDGVTQILADFKKNQMSGRPIVVGSGLFFNHTLQSPMINGANQFGLDGKIQSSMYDFFYDEDFALQVGTNRIGVFEKDSVQLVEYMVNRGSFAGDKGVSQFGVIPIPMDTQRGVMPVMFDYQFKYYDCPTTLTDAYSGGSVSVSRGWTLILSKNFGLWTIPTDAYQSGDELFGNRGTLLYDVTNSCDAC